VRWPGVSLAWFLSLQRNKKRTWKTACYEADAQVEALHARLLGRQSMIDELSARLQELKLELELLTISKQVGGLGTARDHGPHNMREEWAPSGWLWGAALLWDVTR